MKAIYKPLSVLLLAGGLIFSLTTNADAQRGHFGGGFRGGFGGGHYGGGIRFGGGSHFGYGGPRVGVGIGFGSYYRAYPRVGLTLGVLPYGYYPFMWGANQYYYYGGAFYQPYANGGYQVVVPPVGAEVPTLPENARAINIDGNQFYEYSGVYYKEAVTPDGKKVYVVAGKDGVLNTNSDGTIIPDNGTVDQNAQPMPHVGDMTDQLPEGARKVTLNNKKYWVTPDNIYLEEVKNDNGGTSYRVVSIPDDGQQDQQ